MGVMWRGVARSGGGVCCVYFCGVGVFGCGVGSDRSKVLRDYHVEGATLKWQVGCGENIIDN